MTTCLVLGGNGFLGSHIAEALVKRGYSVRVFDNFKYGTTNLQNIKNDIEIINGDFLDENNIDQALKGIDYLFHFISTTVPATAAKDPVFDIETNLIGSVKLLQLAVKNNVQKIIFPSSGGTIYGEPEYLPVKETHPLNPQDPYGISKLAIEKYLYYFRRISGLDYLILRYSNPYGEKQNPNSPQGVIPVFLSKIKKGETPIIYGDGSMARDYIYVKDAIEATISVLESGTKEHIFNIGSGKSTSINELIQILSNIVHKRFNPVYINDNVVRVQKIMLDISRISEQINWKPITTLEQGIFHTWQWLNTKS
jgi:UDP-glucose 4-epimerase